MRVANLLDRKNLGQISQKLGMDLTAQNAPQAESVGMPRGWQSYGTSKIADSVYGHWETGTNLPRQPSFLNMS
jgi:hypothetical protein